jgi:hypothetical protein
MRINVNTDAVIIYTNKLEKLHKSAFPNAVRGALNKTAFNVKQNTLPKSANDAFVNRSPNFFKANSRVDMAKGWKLSEMKATVGMVSSESLNNNFAVKELEQQEHGGVIKKRSFIPMDTSRGGNNKKAVRPGNRLSKISRIVSAKNGNGKHRHEQFIKSAIHAGVGGHIIGNFESRVLWRITSIRKKRVKLRGRSSNTIVKAQPIYTFKENRTIRVKGTSFMEKASLKSAAKLEQFYIEEAKRQIEKLK